MTKQEMIRTEWGSKQVAIEGLEPLSQNKESSLRQEWKTPQDFWRVLNAEFDFNIDVAASRENSLCEFHIDVQEDALNPDTAWLDPSDALLRAYCNPGFGNMLPWIKKASTEALRDPSAIICVLGLCAPSTKWWQKAVVYASEIRLLAPRVQFRSPDFRIPQSSNSRDCALFVFRGKSEASAAHITTWEWRG